ncbi:phage tail protein [Actinobacillus equuli subsp. haemolyticus]|uniref:Phage tail protein n=1 Tax=Actinobacillus equuli subsp. equuli TaxID=202947 RepID=A0A9X4JCB3_ACTEU|nr:phage tail protein [Actinobacillus equuli]MDE8034647.1 phage tail protein [Actinobacillus equuli subsp. equuli]MDG4948714.1 phage tail protein [Actinobacillus equuli subsp. haemolyticus]WGE63792.1 phage tail protein [Actinobacillus equuli subsp. haemolyticus]
MIKPDRLRERLTQTIELFDINPEKLVLQFDNGTIKCVSDKSPSFEYHYDLLVSVIDFPLHPDVLFVPVIEFVRTEQDELVLNPTKTEKIKFDIIRNNNKTYDIYISIPLTERVIAKTDGNSYQIYHGNEPKMTENNYINKLKVYLRHSDEYKELIFDSETQS